MCVCVCVREREREREGNTHTIVLHVHKEFSHSPLTHLKAMQLLLSVDITTAQ